MSKILGPLALIAAFAFVSPALASSSPDNGAYHAAATNCVASMPSQQHAALQTAGTQTAQASNMPAHNYNRPNFAPGD